MGLFNPSADLEFTVKQKCWTDCVRLYGELSSFVSDAVTLSEQWIQQDATRGCNVDTEQRFERWTEMSKRASFLADQLEVWKRNADRASATNSKVRKPILEARKFVNFGASGSQLIMMTFFLWILEPRKEPLPSHYRIWLGRVNEDIYALNKRLVLVSSQPRWTNLKELAPGPDRVITVTARIQANLAEVESALTLLAHP